MTVFETLFGLGESEIRKNCIICPANDSFLFIKAGRKSGGLIFSATNSECFTIIAVKNNFLAGDCVLSLKDTPCENIFLFGSCASTGQAPVGSMHLPEKSFSLESFSRMLEKEAAPKTYFPDKGLSDMFLEYSKENIISPLNFCHGQLASARK